MGSLSTTELAELLRPFRNDFSFYAPRALKIRSKDGAIVPFMFNAAQKHLHERLEEQRRLRGRVRALVLKGRQQGISTYVEGRYYWRVSGEFGKRAFILTHLAEATSNLFAMTKRYHDHCPDVLKPHTSGNSVNALKFSELDSEFSVATAGSKGTGRSATAQFFHGCLAAGTPVVDGETGRLIPIEQWEIGEPVRTHSGALAAVSFKSTQQKQCIEIVMRGLRDFPLVCTPEHRFWTQDGWREAGALRAGDRIGYPIARLTGEMARLPFAIPLAQRRQGGGAEMHVPSSIPVNRALGLVLGLYLAEGCTKRQSTGVLGSVAFAMHEREVERNLGWIEALRGCFSSAKVARRRNSKTVAINVYGKAFATRVAEWCGELDGKRLPAWWRHAPREFVEGMVCGYLSGDGHFSAEKYDRRIRATSIRSAITIGMRDAIAALGYGWAGVEHKQAGVRHGRREREAWILNVCGLGVDSLAALCGKDFAPRKRKPSKAVSVYVEGGYAWVPIISVEDAGERTVYDFEIGHEDHSYCILHGATHNSEVAFWENALEHMAGIGQIVPNADGTEIILESTANGEGNLFHSMWADAERGVGEYIAVFIPWFWQPEYAAEPPEGWTPALYDGAEYGRFYGLTPQQLYWRECKIRDDFRGDTALFDQEYPAEPSLAFRRQAEESYIPPALVKRARMTQGIEPSGAKIMALDPAEMGSDDAVCGMRQGRVILPEHYVRWHGKEPMELVGLTARLADEWQPDFLAVDATGMGSPIADRLRELGYPVVRVVVGRRANDEERFVLVRDELWGLMKDWLEDEPCQIPDCPVLQSELTSVPYTYDSSRRVKLQSKEYMRRKGLKSPDGGDMIALTFGVPAHTDFGARRIDHRRRVNWRAR